MKKTFFIILMGLLLASCTKSTNGPKKEALKSEITFFDEQNKPVSFVYIFQNDTLIATTGTDGQLLINSFSDDSYQLTCSALGFLDKNIEFVVTDGQTSTFEFSLETNNETGKLKSEFQDMTLFQQEITYNPELPNWNDKDMFDGVTGATIQEKWLRADPPTCQIIIGDSLVDITDGFGQGWTDIQQGTYLVTGVAKGYVNFEAVVKINAGADTYLAFLMERN